MIVYPDLHEIKLTTKSNAEIKVARFLSNIEAKDAVAFHSVKLRSHKWKQQAEADFIVLWKGVVIVVEVKGGGVKKHEGIWYSVDRNGNAHKLSESPMQQSRQAMYALRNILNEDGLGWFGSEAIVVTPDIDAPPSSTEWKSSHWLASQTLTVDRLASALDLVAQSAPKPPHNQRRASVPELRKKLHGEFVRFPGLGAQSRAVVAQQMEATEDQAAMLAGLSKNDRIVVLGGAGTGKSVLLAEAAKQEAAAGKSVLVTFLSPSLRRFFADRLGGREIRIEEYARLSSEEEYDVVLIDEAQDLMTAEDMDRLDELVTGGRTGGRWRMFLDHNNQAHVDGAFDSEVFDLIASDATEYALTKNVRNTNPIVQLVQDYLHADVGDPGIVHGAKVGWEQVSDGIPITRAFEVAESIVSQSVEPESIWIISVTGASVTRENHKGIRVLDPREAKGLEAEHVIVCDLPDDYSTHNLAALYVAVTRARVTLHVVLDGEDGRRLRRLVAEGKIGS